LHAAPASLISADPRVHAQRQDLPMNFRSSAVVFACLTAAGLVRAAPDTATAPVTDFTALECLRVLHDAQDAAAAMAPERRPAIEYCIAYLAFRTRQLNEGLAGATSSGVTQDPPVAPVREFVPVVPRETAPADASSSPTVAEEIAPVDPPAVEPAPAMRAVPVPSPHRGMPQPPNFLEGF
jgi:hypothetical protein